MLEIISIIIIMMIIINTIIVEIAVVGVDIVMRIRNSNLNSDNTTPTTTHNNKTYRYDCYDTCIMSKDINMIRFERPIGIASSDPPIHSYDLRSLTQVWVKDLKS